MIYGESFEFGDVTQIHTFLDKFYMSRIGIRILIGQYLELRREEQLQGYVGLINMHTSPAEIFSQVCGTPAYSRARACGHLCARACALVHACVRARM